jgi:thiamine pyrophosphate-dependent enzyme
LNAALAGRQSFHPKHTPWRQMDIGLTQLPSFHARSCLNAGTYGTMGVGLGQAIAAAVAEPAGRPPLRRLGDRLLGHGDGDPRPLQLPGQEPVSAKAGIVVLNNGGIGPGMPEIPEKPDVQHEAQLADLRRALRPDDGSLRPSPGQAPAARVSLSRIRRI